MLKTKQGKVKIIKKKIQLCSRWFWGSHFPPLNHRFWSLPSGFHITAAWHSTSLAVLDGRFFCSRPSEPSSPHSLSHPSLNLKSSTGPSQRDFRMADTASGWAGGLRGHAQIGARSELPSHHSLCPHLFTTVLPILPWLGLTVMATYITTSSRPKAPPSACPDGQLHS